MESIAVQGESVPAIGLGTWALRGAEAVSAVLSALELGYRHIDTAALYRNEAEIGQAISRSRLPRESIFLVTKVWHTDLRGKDVMHSCEQSLARLGLDYVDLLLIHAPNRSIPLDETLRAMNGLQSEGKVRHIGVSNFSVDQLEEARRLSSTPILCNQVEYHPFIERNKLLSYCRENDVLLVAYTPFARGRVLREPVIQRIADEHSKTSAQVVLRWLIQQPKVATIPKSADSGRQRENLEVFDFSLTEVEMEQIAGL